MATAGFVILAYLLGSIPFAVVASKAFGLPDPRSYGSGNPGATNVLRTGRKGAAALTLLGDAALSAREIRERTWAAKRALGDRLVILGHHYQRESVMEFADFRGDSFKLSQLAAQQQEAEFIVFCGVHFMAESADDLRRPHQAVILPDLKAGCSMADMAGVEDVEEAWERLTAAHGDTLLPVTYMNSTADLKAFCGARGGVVCTSSNARVVLEWAWERKARVSFFPDQHLGRNTAYAMGVPLEHMAEWEWRTHDPATVNARCFRSETRVVLSLDIDYILSDLPSLFDGCIEGIERSMSLVRDLRTFSRIDQSDLLEIDLHESSESTINLLRARLSLVRLERDYDRLPPVECLAGQLNHVIMNLLVNALDAMNDEGVLTIRTRLAGDRVRIEVEDTGCGIPPESLDHIFEPFYTTKPVGKGTGLGLSITYGIVPRHRGSITVRSEPGRGTCFSVELPTRFAGDLQAPMPS